MRWVFMANVIKNFHFFLNPSLRSIVNLGNIWSSMSENTTSTSHLKSISIEWASKHPLKNWAKENSQGHAQINFPSLFSTRNHSLGMTRPFSLKKRKQQIFRIFLKTSVKSYFDHFCCPHLSFWRIQIR